jgi:hypothetical protein
MEARLKFSNEPVNKIPNPDSFKQRANVQKTIFRYKLRQIVYKGATDDSFQHPQ